MKKKKTPWKDRTELLKDLTLFIHRNGSFFNQNSKRMSDLFEMSVYNDVVKFYTRKKYTIQIKNLMRDGTFKYKLSTAGLSNNFSFFIAEKNDTTIEIHHNIKLQSNYDDHIYYTADVSVCCENGVMTQMQKNKKRHSFIENNKVITFFEVKNMNPFPEILLSFSGIVLEIMPDFILQKNLKIGNNLNHLTPSIVFSGEGSQYSEEVAKKLSTRFGYNIIRGLFKFKSKIYSFDSYNTF